MKKYFVIAGHIISKHDGPRHECVLINKDSELMGYYNKRHGKLIELRPRFDGYYEALSNYDK